MFLITGATGQLGQLVIKQLLKVVPADRIVAGARTVERGAAFAEQGVQVRHLDYTKPETIAAALDGVTRVLLISSNDLTDRPAQHQRVIDAAKAAGVELLAYTSILKADSSPLMLAADHYTTEQALRASGVPFTLLRNGWYHENYTGDLAGTIARGMMIGAAQDGTLNPAAREDFAAAAAAVLVGEGHEGKVYELAGDEALSLPDLAAIIAEVSGKPVTYNDMPAAAYAGVLESVGLPAGFAAMLADSDEGIARGYLADDSGTLRELIGRPTTPFADVIRAALA